MTRSSGTRSTTLAAAAGVEPRWRATIAKRIPVAAGLGGGSSDAATALRLANETLGKPLPPDELHSLAATLGADVPFFLADGPQLGRGDGSELEPVDLPQDYWIVVALPLGATKESTAAVYRRFDDRAGADGWETRNAALQSALAAVKRPRDLAALPPNDLASSPLDGRAPPARRLPRRRQRSRPGRLRALPSPASRRCGQAGSSERRPHLADRSGLVRLGATVSPMDPPLTIEHGSNRFGRALRENRLKIALDRRARRGSARARRQDRLVGRSPARDRCGRALRVSRPRRRGARRSGRERGSSPSRSSPSSSCRCSRWS